MTSVLLRVQKAPARPHRQGGGLGKGSWSLGGGLDSGLVLQQPLCQPLMVPRPSILKNQSQQTLP